MRLFPKKVEYPFNTNGLFKLFNRNGMINCVKLHYDPMKSDLLSSVTTLNKNNL